MGFVMDIKTIIIVLFLGNLFNLILIISYSYKKSLDKSIVIFILSKILQLIAWTLIGLRGMIPDAISVLVANLMLLGGASLESCAVLILNDLFNKKIKKSYILITSLVLIAFIIAYNFYNYENVRISLVSASIAIVAAYPAYRLAKYPGSTLLQKIWGYIYGLIILTLVYRAYNAAVLEELKVFDNSFINGWTFLAVFVHMIVLNNGFVLLAKEKADLKLMESATIDELTKILNRRTFLLESEKYISLSARTGEPISFMMIDIDGFKQINDSFGHIAGDLVLKETVNMIQGQLRLHDLFGRFGGDEFAVLLSGADEQSSNEVAERLRRSVGEHVFEELNKASITISIGVTTVVPNQEMHLDILYKLSDDALYEAKKQGKNRIARKV